MSLGKKGGQFTSVQRVAFDNPSIRNAREMQTIRSSDPIPGGWSLSGITYQNDAQGGHAGTLFHIKPQDKPMMDRLRDMA